MTNPFTYYKVPASAKEHQSNANYFTYERQGAEDELRGYDRDKIKAPADIIANVSTARWVEREHIRLAQQAWVKAKTG